MSVPFFGDFVKTTKDFYKKDKYDLGKAIEITNNCCDDVSLKAKIKSGNTISTKFIATIKRDNGREIEVTEDLNKGLSVSVKIPKLYRNIDISSEHSNNDVKITAKYKPKGTYYNTKLIGYYNPDKNGNRVCKTTAEFAVGDDQLNLCVGGKIIIKDKSKINSPINGVKPQIGPYSLGFLYRPAPKTEYSVIYTPDDNSIGMEYEFTCFKEVNDKCCLTAKAKGKVDTKLTGFPPVISIAGGWTMGANYLQGFVNSSKEWGMAYKVKITDTTTLNLGLASYLDNNNRINSKFGYKLCV